MTDFDRSEIIQKSFLDSRQLAARDAVYQWLRCNSCGKVLPGGTWLKTAPGPWPTCECGSTDRDHWPVIECAEVFVVALLQDWEDDSQRVLGIILLAGGAEVLFEQFLYEYVTSKSGDIQLAEAILDQSDSITRRINFFKSARGISLKDFWKSDLPSLSDDWDDLREDRNQLSHGRLFGAKLRFNVSAESFVRSFLRGMADLHNRYVVSEQVNSTRSREDQ